MDKKQTPTKTDTVTISIKISRTVLTVLRQEAPGICRMNAIAEMRLTAAVTWYEMQLISQAKAAEVAGLAPAFLRFALSI